MWLFIFSKITCHFPVTRTTRKTRKHGKCSILSNTWKQKQKEHEVEINLILPHFWSCTCSSLLEWLKGLSIMYFIFPVNHVSPQLCLTLTRLFFLGRHDSNDSNNINQRNIEKKKKKRRWRGSGFVLNTSLNIHMCSQSLVPLRWVHGKEAWQYALRNSTVI